MTNVESKRRHIKTNYGIIMCISLKWFLKVQISPPVFYNDLYVLKYTTCGMIDVF